MVTGTVKWFNAEKVLFLSNAENGDDVSYISQLSKAKEFKILEKEQAVTFDVERRNRDLKQQTVNKSLI